jgi:hypothetical protein
MPGSTAGPASGFPPVAFAAMSEDPGVLEARIAELERRMDQVLGRIGYLPGQTPIRQDDAHWQVAPEVLDKARSGKEKDLAAAILMHMKQVHCEPEVARQAIEAALGR